MEIEFEREIFIRDSEDEIIFRDFFWESERESCCIFCITLIDDRVCLRIKGDIRVFGINSSGDFATNINDFCIARFELEWEN